MNGWTTRSLTGFLKDGSRKKPVKKYENLAAGMNKGLLFWHPCFICVFIGTGICCRRHGRHLGTFPIMVLCIGSGTHDLSCVLLLVTQAGVGWLCSRKGRDRWQPKGLPHPLSGDFCRPGYGGTDVLYRLGCDVLRHCLCHSLPACRLFFVLGGSPRRVRLVAPLLDGFRRSFEYLWGNGPIVAAPPFGRAFL